MEQTSIDLKNRSYNICLHNAEDKVLILDFNTDKLKISGDLPYDEAAKIFFNHVSKYFQEAINKQVEIRLKEIEENNGKKKL